MRLLESELYRKDLEYTVSKLDLSGLEGKSIFISGGLGMICSAVADVLITYGKTGRIFIGSRNKEQFMIRFGEYKNVSFVQYDALKDFKIDIKPDYIIHGAGLASPELYTSKPVETILSNFNGVHSLLEYARGEKVSRILFVSSSEVYGRKDSDAPFKEGCYGEIDIDNIRSSYAVAKRASEMICKSYTLEYGVDTVIVRPGHIYGPSAKTTDKRISSDFAYKASRGEELIMKSSGIQKRSYCYTLDCAAQILTVLLKGKSGNAYNVGHDEVITIRQMAELLAKAGGVKLSVAEPTVAELRNFNPMNNSSLENSSVKSLGYRDAFTAEEGMSHTVKILKECFSR